MKNKVGFSLMIFGLFLILSSFGLMMYNRYEDKHASQTSQRVIQQMQIDIETIKKQNEEMPIVEIEEYSYIGYLSIPRLDLELPVMADWSYKQLKIAPCRQTGSTVTDDLVIAAHNYRSHFGYIGSLNYNDRILFTNMNGETIEYAVQLIEQLEANESDRMLFSEWDLTLYTCNYSGQSRITIRANRLQ